MIKLIIIPIIITSKKSDRIFSSDRTVNE